MIVWICICFVLILFVVVMDEVGSVYFNVGFDVYEWLFVFVEFVVYEVLVVVVGCFFFGIVFIVCSVVEEGGEDEYYDVSKDFWDELNYFLVYDL